MTNYNYIAIAVAVYLISVVLCHHFFSKEWDEHAKSSDIDSILNKNAVIRIIAHVPVFNTILLIVYAVDKIRVYLYKRKQVKKALEILNPVAHKLGYKNARQMLDEEKKKADQEKV